MEQTIQKFQTQAVVPFALVLYDYAITFDEEVKYIWTKSMSTVTLIYLVLRYFGILIMLFYTIVFLSDWDTSSASKFSDGSYNNIFPILELWPIVVAAWLVHVILQMRLYALYNRSKRVLSVMITGFIIEVAAMLVTMIRLTIFEVNGIFNQSGTVSDSPAAETTDIYVSYSVSLVYELLLFSLALWAAIQSSSRRPTTANRIGARGLRLTVIEGNVMYFLVILLFLLAYLIASLASPVEYITITTNFGFAMYIITGTRVIVQIRSVAATSSINVSQSQTRGQDYGQDYSRLVFRVPTNSTCSA